MSIFSSSSSTRSARPQAPPPHPSDQKITLIDTTLPPTQPSQPTTDSEDLSPALSNSSLVHKFTTSSTNKRLSLREELTRRKYAKWQMTQEPSHGHEPDSGIPSRSRSIPLPDDEHPTAARDGEGNGAAKRSTQPAADTKQEPYEIDILYENQRGWFVWGIPFYSSKSLLNFDPSPWVTAQFKESPVDITDAQVPDPSWEWSWKSWYVDMSEDVDEQGWQYSFSFNPAFSWHGVHVRLNSWVRRRRWIRKRVRRHPQRVQRGQSYASEQFREGHIMNGDYFTIHSSREQLDRASTINAPSQKARSSHASRSSHATEEDEDDDLLEITQIGTLMKVLRRPRIDREKIAAVIEFVDSGGEEVYYLAERMSEIMHTLIFQSSRRHLLSHLLHTFDAASSHRDQHERSNNPEDATEKRRIDNILRAVQAAEHEVRQLEYWSDARGVRNSEGHPEEEDQYSEGGKKCAHGWEGMDGTEDKDGGEDRDGEAGRKRSRTLSGSDGGGERDQKIGDNADLAGVEADFKDN